MAKKKNWLVFLWAVWLSFVNDILLLAIGSALAFGGLTLPLVPNWVALAVGWTAIVIAGISLILWVISFIRGLMKRLM